MCFNSLFSPPHSIFYVFYEQYLTIYKSAAMNLSICTGAIFIITFLLLGCDVVSAVICTFTIIMITVDLMGVMYLWDIQLNAVSVVNLVMVSGPFSYGGAGESFVKWSGTF